MKQNREIKKLEIQQLYKILKGNSYFYNDSLKNLNGRLPILKLMDVFQNEESCRIDINDYEYYWLVKNYNNLIKDKNVERDVTFKVHKNEFDEFDEDFSTREINESEMYLISSEIDSANKKKQNVLSIENIYEVVEDEEYCSVKVSGSELSKIFNSVSWNPFSQREVTVKNTRLGNVMIPTVYRKNVEEIKESMKEGTFRANMISLNILKTDDDTEKYEFDDETNTLNFEKAAGSILDCIDGYHRLTAISELMSEDKEFGDNIHMQLKVWHMDIREASAFVSQESSGNLIKIEKKEITADDMYMDIVKSLNNDGNKKRNALKDTMGEDNEISADLKIFSSALFKQSIEDNIKFKNAGEARKFKRLLQDCWNLIIFNNEEIFKNYKNTKKETALVSFNIPLFFNEIIIKLFDKKMDKEEILELLEDILENVDYNLDKNNKWNDIYMKNSTTGYNKTNKAKIYAHARKILKEVL